MNLRAGSNLAEELLSLSGSAAALRVRNSPRYLREDVCRLLIDMGYSARFADPAGALRREELAAAIADEMLRRAPAPHLYRLASEARSYLGNARRVVGEFRGARVALREAEALRRRGPQDHELRALILEFRASLAQAERRFADAGRHLNKAGAIWARRGDSERLARVFVLAGIAQAYAGETETALEDLRQGLRLTSSLPLIRCALLSMAWVLVDACHAEAALNLISPYLEMLRAGERQAELKLIWIQGRIATELECDASGLAHLEAARSGFNDLEMLQEWALVTLDLAVHHGRNGRLFEVRRLAEEAAPVILSLGVGSHAIVAGHLAKIAAAGELLPAAANAISRMVRPRGVEPV